MDNSQTEERKLDEMGSTGKENEVPKLNTSFNAPHAG